MRNIFLVGVVLLFSGCVSKSSLAKSSNVMNFCSNDSVLNTYDFLVKKMQNHYLSKTDGNETVPLYTNTGAMVEMDGKTYIEHEKNDNNIYEISVSKKIGLSPKVYGELINIFEGSNDCITKVEVKYISFYWKKDAVLVEGWLKNK